MKSRSSLNELSRSVKIYFLSAGTNGSYNIQDTVKCMEGYNENQERKSFDVDNAGCVTGNTYFCIQGL